MPDFAIEVDLQRKLRSRHARPMVIGLDEAGRGPWAGPVVAAAVWLHPEGTPPALCARLDDSKALSAATRNALFEAIMDGTCAGYAAVGIAQASVAEIDEINILQASLRAMARAAARLSAVAGRMPCAALIDGPQAPRLACPAHPVVGGDGRSLSIAAASILAKVTRDRLMAELAREHPGYGWERNKGYGTAEHRAALATLGLSPEHRRSFRPVREAALRAAS